MTLFWELLPLYLFGNVHCLAMCGPLVAFLGKSPYRFWYFWGRIASFSLVGAISSFLGLLITAFLNGYHLGFLFSLVLGLFMILASLLKRSFIPVKILRSIDKYTMFLLSGGATATFLFGASTVLLPCGQSAIVFAACALSTSEMEGLFNGFSLAAFTTPALFFSMESLLFLRRWRQVSDGVIRYLGVSVGILACLRAFSSIGWIPHASFPFWESHIVFW